MEWIVNALINMTLLLAFIVVVLIWAALIFVIVYETIEAWKEHNRKKDNEEYDEYMNRRNTL